MYEFTITYDQDNTGGTHEWNNLLKRLIVHHTELLRF